jgi:hypothetical protein
MEFIILDEPVIKDNQNLGDFVYIVDKTDTTANVNISNTNAYFSVPIGDNLKISVNDFFKQLKDQ